MKYELEATETRVSLWSDIRLPFEPKGEVRAMRDELRSALSLLRGDGLFADFSGPAAHFDLENVLFYNVGCSTFRHIASQSLRFERRFESRLGPNGQSLIWHHEYSTEPLAPSWQVGATIATLRLAGSGSAPGVASKIWEAAHRSRVRQFAPGETDSPLFLRLSLTTERSVNLTEIVKRLIDGLFCSLHSYAGVPPSEIVDRVARSLSVDTFIAQEWLTRPGPLGPAKFLWPFGNNLQWSPADDRIVAVEMVGRIGQSGSWTVEAGLFEATARN